MSARKTWIGTSGWHYGHWRGPVYPEKLPTWAWLGRYAERLHAVEINNSFYKLPKAETLAEWTDQVPQDFRFAVKAPRGITHMRKLRNCADQLETFLERVSVLEGRLGPVLFQLPPNWHRNSERLDEFLGLLPAGVAAAVELRDRDWHHPETYDVLRAHNAAFCVWDLEGFLAPEEVTADFVYVRLHGPGETAYTGRYSAAALRRWAERIARWRRKGLAVWVFFDNDENGYAAKNAWLLQRYVDEGLGTP